MAMYRTFKIELNDKELFKEMLQCSHAILIVRCHMILSVLNFKVHRSVFHFMIME